MRTPVHISEWTTSVADGDKPKKNKGRLKKEESMFSDTVLGLYR